MDDEDRTAFRRRLRRWAPALVPVLVAAWILFLAVLIAGMPPAG